ncbi:MAG TPA: tetratricopeptide repeat protein [Thermoanaerobaculia bacterium]|nr:tetratricopeptide repeat protein [Thermoanaerobaculia bacterium]
MAATRDQLLQSAERAAGRGKLDQALKDYLRVLDDNPKDIATLNKVGDLYVRMNRAVDSIVYFSRIADHYSRDGFFLKAIAIYKKINKIDPARLEVYDRLADLYHKQGLTQDARSQYQVLADHYQKNNKPDEAIAAYKKMATVDPNDLKIQVKLADLYRANHQIEQAVMQYGLIGSMLLRRGAHDEAAAVFQKALELSPNDTNIQRNLVRSLIAQKNPSAAIAILRAVPRTADSLSLLAEAQLELGQRNDAARSVEQGIALDARHEECRVLLARIRAAEGSFDAALAAVLPVVDSAAAGGDFARGAAFLAPILHAEPAHRPTLNRLAEVHEMEGNAAEAARVRLTLAHEDERYGEAEAAADNYRRVLALVPGQPEAAARLSELAPAGVVPPPPPPPPSFEVNDLVVELEEPAELPDPVMAPIEPIEPMEEKRVAPEAPPAPRSAEEQEIETLVVEAEVFAKYGLTDKAIERLRVLTRRRPDLHRARERLVELLAESQNQALQQEAESLARAYREKGETARADDILARFGGPAEALGSPPAALPPPAASFEPPETSPEVQFDEFEIEPMAPAPPEEVPEPIGNETIRFSEHEVLGAEPSPPPTPSSARPTPIQAMAPVESDFVSYEELGSLLEEEMHKAGEAPAKQPPPPATPPAGDDQNLFADEQQFFNLAEELERELADEATPPMQAPDMGGPEGEASLEDIFREFKRGVEQQLSAEDYETHFNLGIAYKEMGLTDEAIGEFQLASKDPGRAVECCSMLGLCFLEKGMPPLAIKWYQRGLDTPGIKEAETVGMLYDLACVYQSTGETELAYKSFLEVYGLNSNYRDVVHRVRELEAAAKGN